MICIYSITNKINNKIYVGQTLNFIRRKRQHLTLLRKGEHPIQKLQNDYIKYGENNFIFEAIIECKKEDLNYLEKVYIKELNAFEDNGGYNKNTGGKSQYKLSKTTKEKISKLAKERYKNDNTCFDPMIKGNKQMWSDPVRKQQVVKNMKASFTEERRKQLSESAINSWTDERKEQKSRELIERYSNPEERQKQSEIVKEAMSKLPKEKLSRRHVSKLSIETLLDMVENRHLTQKQMAEKYNTTIANAKGIKSGKHWIYDHMRENNIPIKELPKNQKFRCSVSTEVLLNIVKDKDMKRSELFEKYNNVSQKIIGQIRNGSHWIYEYIEENKII